MVQAGSIPARGLALSRVRDVVIRIVLYHCYYCYYIVRGQPLNYFGGSDNMKCEECGNNKDLIKFTGDREYWICEVCLDEKTAKGVKNFISSETYYKHFRYNPKTGQR